MDGVAMSYHCSEIPFVFYNTQLADTATGGGKAALALSDLFEKGLDLRRYPALEMLLRGGLPSLYSFALRLGYEPVGAGYGSSCHLCLDMRVFLYQQGFRFPEFYPDFLYEELGKKRNGGGR
jgi:hypothetical protein